RRTFGFKKDSDSISLRQMVEGITTRDGKRLDHGTGLSMPTVTAAVKSLVERGIIIATRNQSAERGDEATTYELRFRDTRLKKFKTGSKISEDPRLKKFKTQETVEQETVEQETESKYLRSSDISPSIRTRTREKGNSEYEEEQTSQEPARSQPGLTAV